MQNTLLFQQESGRIHRLYTRSVWGSASHPELKVINNRIPTSTVAPSYQRLGKALWHPTRKWPCNTVQYSVIQKDTMVNRPKNCQAVKESKDGFIIPILLLPEIIHKHDQPSICLIIRLEIWLKGVQTVYFIQDTLELQYNLFFYHQLGKWMEMFCSKEEKDLIC